MQILRFDEEETPAPKRKRTSGPSKGLLVVAAVAVLFGVGTAFASSTISINNNGPVTLGQGVSQVTGCDSSITVGTAAGLDLPQATASPAPAPSPSFYLTSLTVSNIDNHPGNSVLADSPGCGDKYLKVQLFYTDPSKTLKQEKARTCSEMAPATSGSPPTSPVTCLNDALFLKIATGTTATYQDTINFPKTLSSDLDYVTLVSTDTAA